MSKINVKEVDDIEVAEIPVTRIGYCQSCGKDFVSEEIVYFAVIDNNLVCRKCSEVHTQKEARLYLQR